MEDVINWLTLHGHHRVIQWLHDGEYYAGVYETPEDLLIPHLLELEAKRHTFDAHGEHCLNLAFTFFKKKYGYDPRDKRPAS